MFGSVRELFAYKSMLRSLVKREVRGRYKGSLLGFLWNFTICSDMAAKIKSLSLTGTDVKIPV